MAVMTDESNRPTESYSREEIDDIRRKIREALEAVDAAIARRRRWVPGDKRTRMESRQPVETVSFETIEPPSYVAGALSLLGVPTLSVPDPPDTPPG